MAQTIIFLVGDGHVSQTDKILAGNICSTQVIQAHLVKYRLCKISHGVVLGALSIGYLNLLIRRIH